MLVNCGYQRLHKTALVTPSLASMITCQLDGINCRAGSQRKLVIFFSSRLGNKNVVHSGSFLLTLALSDFPLALSAAHTVTLAHSGSFWLSLALSLVLSGAHRLTRSLLSSQQRRCWVATVYPALHASNTHSRWKPCAFVPVYNVQ